MPFIKRPSWSLQDLCRERSDTRPDRAAALNWTVPLRREQMEHATGRRLCESTIREALHREGYAWKRPRYKLQPDPDPVKQTLLNIRFEN